MINYIFTNFFNNKSFYDNKYVMLSASICLLRMQQAIRINPTHKVEKEKQLGLHEVSKLILYIILPCLDLRQD